MSEEFIRCAECGNLNILGTIQCVFCENTLDGEISETTEETKYEVPLVSDIPVTSPVEETPSPEIEEGEKKSLPKIPDITVAPQQEKKEVVIEEVTTSEASNAKKFLMISVYSILIGLAHYLLNLLVSVISVKITDENTVVLPLSPSLTQTVGINAASIILGIPFAVLIGYAIGKIVRRYSNKKSSLIGWFSYAVVLDMILTTGITAVLIYTMDVYYRYIGYPNGLYDNPNSILLLKISGSAIILFGISIITLFLPMIAGAFLAFSKMDRVFFPKKYVEF